MKKILLTITLMTAAYFSNAQAVLNEIWYNPGANDEEYIEIYNPGAPGNLDCYTILSYYNTGNTSGFIVINFPDNIILESGGYTVLSSTLPFNYQGTVNNQEYVGTANDFAWTPAYLAANGGYIKNYERSGSVYNETTIANYNDILRDLGNNAQPASFITMLYRGGILINALEVGGGATSVAAALKAMPNLTVSGGSCGNFTAIFSTILNTQIEYMSKGIGAGNGVHRTSDGRCGTWAKSASGSDDTPGASNGPSDPITGVIEVGGGVKCAINEDADFSRDAEYFIVNASTPTTAYPLVLLLYSDNGTIPGDFDSEDEFLAQREYPTATPGLETNVFKLTGSLRNKGIIIVARSTAGCFETIQAEGNTCSTLPVKLKSFTASRKQTNVELKWTTTLEQNNSGFELQRQSGAGGWQKIGFVNSKATDGNSVSDLNYSFTDVNDSRGVSQYRLMQVDLDDNAKYSEIRSVQGMGQEARTIISPNPTANGRVNVTFQSASSKKDLQLTDMHGRMLKQWNAYSDNSLQITDLTPGIYQLRIVDRETGTQTVEKIMVVNR